MDDTSRRVDRGDEMASRAPDDMTGRADESTRGFAPTGDAAPGDADVDARTTEIRRDIEHTREEMSETIDAIQEKLRPANLVSSAAERVKDAATQRVRHMTQSAGDAANSMMARTRDTGDGLVDQIRENPMPAMLIGIGAAWWLMNSRKSHDDDRYARGYWQRRDVTDRDRGTWDYPSSGRQESGSHGGGYGTDYGRSGFSTESQWPSDMRSTGSVTSGLMERVRDNPVPAALASIGLGWLALASGRSGADWDRSDNRGRQDWNAESDTSSSTMSNAAESVSNAASGVADSAQEMTRRAQEYTREATSRARQASRRAQSQLQRMTVENPLAVGAGALLLGAAVGLAIPETERENELLGETRDSMVDRAQEMARNAASRAQDAAADLAGEAANRIVGGKTE